MTTKKDLMITFFSALITGFVGQTLIPMLSKGLKFSYWDFSIFVSDLDIYPLVIVLMICLANNGPKHVLLRILTYFVGLCVGYYGWECGLMIYGAVMHHDEHLLGSLLLCAGETAAYIIFGFLASIWGYFTSKFERKRVVFCLLISPFVIVELMMACFNLMKVDVNILMTAVDLLCMIGIFYVARKRIKNTISSEPSAH